ncbi:50S ribosomal protein L14 [Wickerhamomyces ciferrii]|uniref:Large ribosomal subunit protein uL14m n=1 Tax=Wickerhamomyces ciferrii (strain ATCC 14091 / BCRC 22168 / CBS 111 / JCM 3599 / NBRC 0793 / NRRL Y-1031 F-60-10) TaxID=1206466 RepID=K0KXY6_WICCF|nr:50S ribosomal protein L14 [Wickerhamomyces ciferrii]CCH46932.1 50S ribosomal protein L14 [Wickerhamomyces ciferrii]
MLYLKSMLKVIDNSGGLMAECIKVLRKSPKNYASVGDKIVVVVQKARPATSMITGASASNRVKKGDIVHAVVVRTKQNVIRPDGSVMKFDDNACVLLNKNNEPLGTRISSVVSRQLKDKGYNKIISLAPKAV